QHRSRQRARLCPAAQNRRGDALLAGKDGARRRRYGPHDARVDRAGAGSRRHLLPSVPSARVARSVDARLSTRRRICREETRARSGSAVSQPVVGRLFRKASVTPMSKLRTIAFVYMLFLLAVACLNYVPGITDAQGKAFGIFALDRNDDLLHLF